MRPFVLSLVVLLAARPASALPPPSAVEIDRLVKQLGDGDYRNREAATKSLQALGKRAVPALRGAKDAKDAEVRRRAERVLAATDTPASPVFSVTTKGGRMCLVGPRVKARADVVTCDDHTGIIVLKGNAEMVLERGPGRASTVARGEEITFASKSLELFVNGGTTESR